MSLQGSLNIALQGLRVTNNTVDVAARNIANSQTPGYSRKVHVTEATVSNGVVTGVRTGDIRRDVDLFLQAQLRTEIGIAAQVDVKAEFLTRVDLVFGRPGDSNALDTIINDFDSSLQGLVTSPEDFGARNTAVNQAVVLADQLNRLSDEIQALRQQAESGLADAASEANAALGEIARLNGEIQQRFDSNLGVADLEDQRDIQIDKLAQLIDVRTTQGERGTVRVFTTGGNLLVDSQAVTLSFDEHSGINATSLYNVDDAQRGVGTLKLTNFGGAELDLFRHGTIGSGKIAAFRELRDVTLVQAQAQLDELAHGLALSMSQVKVDGVAATAGTQTGFDINVADLVSGNQLSLTVGQGATQQTFTFIRVDDPASLPLSNDATTNPNDTVIGIDFSGGLAGATAAMDAALDAALGVDVSVSSPSADTIRILNDVAAVVSIDAASATVTPTATQDSGLQLALFTDFTGFNEPYSGSFDGGSQKLGFAGRIQVNQAVLADNSLLVSYSTSPPTGSGDPARPLDLLARLSETQFSFSPGSGIGSEGSPLNTSVRDFGSRVINFQAQQTEVANSAQASQAIVIGALSERYSADTGVDIDQELAKLTELQNIYAANARVMTVIQELLDVIVRI